MLFHSFSEWTVTFTLYSMLGWACEMVWCGIGTKRIVNRGFLSGPWCPVYGFGAVLILLIAWPLRAWPPLVFGVAMLSASVLEYFTGWLLETLFKTRWWDYSNRPFNLRGRVCLRNSLLFGLLGLALVYWLQPQAAGLLSHIQPATLRVVASILVVVLFFDLLRSLASATNLSQRLTGIHNAIEEMKEYQETYHWYDADDLTASIQRLRAICEDQPDNEAACRISKAIDSHMAGGKGGIRLAMAFPKMAPRQYMPELTALEEQWEARRKQQQHRWRQAKAWLAEKWAAGGQSVRLSYKGVTVTRMVWVFLIGSVIGYVVETLFCLITRGVIESRQGMVYGPFNQVYGFGAVLMVLTLTPFARKGGGWLFAGGAMVGGLFEALCSLVQEYFFGSTSWQYADYPFALLGGRTNLLYMCFWGLLAVIYMNHIYPRMARLIDAIPTRPKRFYTIVIAVFLAVNMALSALAVGRWAGRVEGIAPKNGVEVFLDQYYPNSMLEEIYPNMEFHAAGEASSDNPS